MMSATPSPPLGPALPLTPFPVDAAALEALATEPIIRRGIAYMREHRVLELEVQGERLDALVEGSVPGAPYQVAARLDGDGELMASCTCPFDWEPLCKHIVAALLAHGASLPVAEEALTSAADQAIEARARRGRSEVRVTRVEGEGESGLWHARSILSTSASGRTWRVQLRSTTERINHCGCPDFAVNALGTCKHIEAVLHTVRKSGRGKRGEAREEAREDAPIGPFVHLAWDVADAPELRARRAQTMTPAQGALLDAHFDGEGRLKIPAPGGFFRFVTEATGSGIQIGDDAEAYARRLVEDAARRQDAEGIRREILRSGGQLPGVRARLYPYQVEGVAFLASAGRALLADDMGLGKTLQAIAAASWLTTHRNVERTLVVCPASLKSQWAREIQRFTGMEAQIIEGTPAARRALYRRHVPFTVMNYELVRRDRDLIQGELAPDLLVLDEAQRIKNWRTKLAAEIKTLKTTYAFVLSGTPLENRLEDLYSLMQVVDPRVLGPLWRYMIDFHVLDERGKVLGYRNLSALRRRLAPVMMRRDRQVVRAQLPDRLELRLDLPLDDRQRALHDGAVEAASRLGLIAQRRPLTPSEEKRLLSSLQTARMACDAAGLVDKESVGSPKLDELGRLLEELCGAGGQKVVVFSQWERMTAMAEAVARDLGIGSVRLHGGVPTAKRGALIEAFSTDPEVQIFFSTDAGGVGLNLQAAQALINLDVPWNPAVLEQRIARIHRLGQKRPVQILHLIAQDAYEERVHALMEGKRHLFTHVISEEASEDVVGVSKRSIELLLEALNAAPAAAEPELGGVGTGAGGPPEGALEDSEGADQGEDVAGDAGAEPLEAPTRGEVTSSLRRWDLSEEERAFGAGLAALQGRLGARIERVLGTSGGLVIVVDVVDDAARRAVEDCLPGVPAVAMDAATVASLSRFSGGPLEGARELLEQEAGGSSGASALGVYVARKLKAAEVLIAEGCAEEGVDAIADTMVASAVARGGGDTLPVGDGAASLWLYADALPRGLVTPEEALAIGRALALKSAPNLPMEMLQDMLGDARRMAVV